MDFDSLPSEMAAKVLQYLDLDSLVKICQINKRCGNIVKNYMIDRVEFDKISISIVDDKVIKVESIVSDKRLPEAKPRNWEYIVKWFANGEVPTLDVNEVLDDILSKARSVRRLVFVNFKFSEETVEVLLKHINGKHGYGTGQLKHLEFRGTSLVAVSVDVFMTLINCTKINAIKVLAQCTIMNQLFTNQLLMIRPINLTSINKSVMLEINMPDLNYEYLNFMLNNSDALLWIPYTRTSFTVTQVLEAIQAIILNGDERFWHFGVCHSEGMTAGDIEQHRIIANIETNAEWTVKFDFLGIYYACKISLKDRYEYNANDPSFRNDGLIHFSVLLG